MKHTLTLFVCLFVNLHNVYKRENDEDIRMEYELAAAGLVAYRQLRAAQDGMQAAAVARTGVMRDYPHTARPCNRYETHPVSVPTTRQAYVRPVTSPTSPESVITSPAI